MRKLSLIFIFLSLGLFGLIRCSNSTAVVLDLDTEPFEQLSQYHFFVGEPKQLNPNEGVLPYDLNNALFTDYAEKARFVWMPKGTAANYTSSGPLDFPVGTVLIKNFYYNHQQKRQLIETRLLIHRADGWDALPYIWNAEQSDAKLEIIGGIQEVSFTDAHGQERKVNYVVPNKNQCKGCHFNDNKLIPIGPKARNLNKDFNYKEGPSNQLQFWTKTGYLKGYDASKIHPKLIPWDDETAGSLQDRAMAYLDINCAHCHNPKGPGNTSGLSLMAEEPLGSTVGVWKSPVASGTGSGGRAYSIVPGHPEASILPYRMASTDPGAMMPELGRTLIHEEGVALIKDWISAMDSLSL